MGLGIRFHGPRSVEVADQDDTRAVGMRIRAWWETHWLPAMVMLGALPIAFTAAGWFWGREVIVLPVCTGPLPPAIGDCPPYRYVELNLLAGWAAAALVAVVLVVLGVIARRLDR